MKLSIVMSTYNRCDTFLPKAIQSILSQSFKDYELIIVDDQSTDGTRKYIDSLMFKDKRISYMAIDHFGSDTKPKNTGAKIATGEYLMFVDDDVQLRPEALQTLVEALDFRKDVDVVYGDMWIKPNDVPGIAMDFDKQMLILRNFIDTSVAIIRKEVFEYVGGFDETLPKFIDWNLWVRIMKAGFMFKRIPKLTLDYYLHESSKSYRVQTETYTHPKLGQLFTPTFDPSGCEIKIKKPNGFPKVAIFTIHYDRLEYSKITYKEMKESAGYPFDWFCADNGSKDGTAEWIKSLEIESNCYEKNQGITKASNDLIDLILSKNKYDIIIKIDNDVEFITTDWLRDITDLWMKNHMVYISPYVEGLRDNPGGAPRVGTGLIGNEYLEITKHIGGIFAAISAKAYKKFRWNDSFLHGNQDMEASENFRLQGYMPCYFPKHVICHRDGTQGQHERYKEYFERRKGEKHEKLI